MSDIQKKPESAPAKTQSEQLSEEDLAYVSEHLSDDALDKVAGGGGLGKAGGNFLGETG